MPIQNLLAQLPAINFNPATGDSNAGILGIIVAVLVISLIVIIVLAVTGKKKKKR